MAHILPHRRYVSAVPRDPSLRAPTATAIAAAVRAGEITARAATADAPCLHRRTRRRDRRLPGRARRGRAGRRRRRRRATSGAPTCRSPACRSRSRTTSPVQRRADAHRQRSPRRPPRSRGPRGRAPAARRRRRRRRADPHARAVRVRHAPTRPSASPAIPGDRDRTPGGSSGGAAAAVAAGMVRGRARQRRDGLDPHPGRVLRPGRHQARTRRGAGRISATARGSTWPRTARSRRPSPTARCVLSVLAGDPDARRRSASPGRLRIAVSTRSPIQRRPGREHWAAAARDDGRRAARGRAHRPAGQPAVRPDRSGRRASSAGSPAPNWTRALSPTGRPAAAAHPAARGASAGWRCAPASRSRPGGRPGSSGPRQFFADHDVLLTPALAQRPARARPPGRSAAGSPNLLVQRAGTRRSPRRGTSPAGRRWPSRPASGPHGLPLVGAAGRPARRRGAAAGAGRPARAAAPLGAHRPPLSSRRPSTAACCGELTARSGGGVSTRGPPR